MTEPEQPGFDSRFEWSAEGAALLARACPVVVVVDVLRFTTAVEVAVARGAVVVPRPWVAGRVQADWSSLSPASLLRVPAGTRVELASPNGAMVALAAAGAVLHAAGGRSSPEARTAVAAFLDAAGDLPGLVAGCVSGRELAARGHAADLALAAAHDVSRAVPRLTGGAFAQLS